MPIDFVLEQFNYELEMGVSGELFEIPIPILDASASAEYYVSVSSMRNAFYFQTDSRDITDMSGQDIKYYVNWPAHVILNPCHAYVSFSPIATTDLSGNIPSNRQLVKHDFIRHIAKDLFNTHLAVDLFQNEQALKDDLASKGHSEAWGSILSDISAVSITNTSLSGPDASGEYYVTNDLDTNNNLCRELLGQLLSSAASRVYNLAAITLNNNISLEKFSIPFEHGDSISFKLTLKAAPNQHLLVGKANAVPDRTYRIRLNIVDTVNDDSATYASGTNVIVNDCINNSFLNNSRVVTTVPSGYQAVTAPAVTTASTTSVSNFSLNGAAMFVPGSTGSSTVTLTQASTPPAESTFVSIPSVQTYLKLEPVGAVFTSHVSFEITVTPGTPLSLYFKSSTDLEPVLILSTNTSANDVYYTYVQATGIVTLYTKHFSEVFVTDPAPTPLDLAQSTITLTDEYLNYSLANGTELNTTKTIVNSRAALTYTPLSNYGRLEGTNGTVYAIATDSNGNIYVGGDFTFINNMAVNRIAKYTVSTNTWSTLGTGVSGICRAIYITSNDIMFIGGDFTSVNGVTGVNRIVKYTIATNTFSTLGTGLNAPCNAIAGIDSDSFYLGGNFTTANGITVGRRMAKYTISTNTFTSLLTSTLDGQVNQLVYRNGILYISYQFLSSSHLYSIVAKWNGSSLINLLESYSSSPQVSFYSLAVSSTTIYVGGTFINSYKSDSTSTDNRYLLTYTLSNGTLSMVYPISGLTGISNVSSLYYDNNDNTLYVGTIISTNARIYKYTPATNTASLLVSCQSASSAINNMITYNNELYFGGVYNVCGYNNAIYPTQNFGKFNLTTNTFNFIDTSISTTNVPYGVTINSIYYFDNKLYLGGLIVNQVYLATVNPTTSEVTMISDATLTGSINMITEHNNNLYFVDSTKSLIRWNGTNFTKLSTNTPSGTVNKLIVMNDNLVYMYGSLIYTWTGTTINQLTSAASSTYKSSVKDSSNNLIIAGSFTTIGSPSSTVNYIARYNGTTWSALGSGLGGGCNSIDIDSNDNVYAGGAFITAGGVSSSRVAKWDGTAWTPLGSGLNNVCNTVKIHNNLIYAVGKFTTAGGSACSGIAIWNPYHSVWYRISISGIVSSYDIEMITFDSNYMYIKGVFTVKYGNLFYSNLLKLPKPIFTTVSGLFISGTNTFSNLILGAQESKTLTWNGSRWSVS